MRKRAARKTERGLVTRFLPLLAGAGGLIGLHQLVDLHGALAGSDLATAAGRMRLANALAGRFPAILAADVMLLVATIGLRWTRVGRLLTVAHFGVGAAALVTVPEYLADATAMVPTLSLDEEGTYRLLVLRATMLLAATGACCLLAGLRLRAFSQDLGPAGSAG
ncbi:MAG: hypothetical protein ACRDH5_18625 [bacterium]